MPVQYKTGIIREHKSVRTGAGVFDVSHMGELCVHGPSATHAVQRLVTNDVGTLSDGKALYTVMCLPSGGIVDDCIVYRRSETDYLIVVNASNIDKDREWIRENLVEGSHLRDESSTTALIAVQGPQAVALVDSLAADALADVKSFHFITTHIAGASCMAARTGYTGEDGLEIACDTSKAETVWTALLASGSATPIGLGARDTLRLEARLSLYGNDIDETTSPYEAGLGWVVKLNAGDFIGSEALKKQKKDGVKRKLAGFVIHERAIARHGYTIYATGEPDATAIGHVTSGTKGISVDGAIGLGYVPIGHATAGTEFFIDCRGKRVAATVVKGAFYKRTR